MSRRGSFFASFLALGCGSSSSSPESLPTDSGGSEGGLVDGGPDIEPLDGGPDGRPPECQGSDVALQAALDGAHPKSPNAMLAVKDPVCGVRLLISGDAASATGDSLFQILSVTKTFVSAVILMLEKEGKLSIADPLSKWITGVPKSTGRPSECF